MLQGFTISISPWGRENLYPHGTYRKNMSNVNKVEEECEVLECQMCRQRVPSQRCLSSLIKQQWLLRVPASVSSGTWEKQFSPILSYTLPQSSTVLIYCEQWTWAAALLKPDLSFAGWAASRRQLFPLPRVRQCYLLSVPRQQVLDAGQQI